MSDIIICDTNVAIHLAIICPDILKNPDQRCRIVIHPLVKSELHKLNDDPEKKKRLGSIIDFILKEVLTDAKIHLPNHEKQIRMHRAIQKIESGLDQKLISSNSSHNDRCFLILAKTHSAILLTNEKTLYNLSEALIGSDHTWRTSSAIEKLLALDAVTNETIQKGLSSLENYEEQLHDKCAEKMKHLGFTYL